MNQVQTPIIATFANQKGGVGKSTLCVCFANYLISKGATLRIIDCDRQQSITHCRQRDLNKYGDAMIPYSIDSFRNATRDTMRTLIGELYKKPEIDFILFDCPGGMSDDWLIPLIGNSDIIVIPFRYDNVTITSTSEFILFCERICKSASRMERPNLLLIPNLIDKRVGTKEELEKWDITRTKFSQHGIVSPIITRKADMERYSTISDIEMQSDIVSPAFDLLYAGLFGSLDPLRPPIPTIQVRREEKLKARRINSDNKK